MNYIVTCRGHIAQFAQYEAALAFAGDFQGTVFNLWGLAHLPDADLDPSRSA